MCIKVNGSRAKESQKVLLRNHRSKAIKHLPHNNHKLQSKMIQSQNSFMVFFYSEVVEEIRYDPVVGHDNGWCGEACGELLTVRRPITQSRRRRRANERVELLRDINS